MPYAQRKWKARKPGPRFGIGDSRGLAARRPIAVRREAMDGADVVIIPGMMGEVGGSFLNGPISSIVASLGAESWLAGGLTC